MPNDIMIIWQMIGRDISHVSLWLRQIFSNRGTIIAIIIGIITTIQNYKKPLQWNCAAFIWYRLLGLTRLSCNYVRLNDSAQLFQPFEGPILKVL